MKADFFQPRDDIDPENTWIVSDTHFGHENIVGFCHRPLDHDQVMIAEWRASVPEDATVVHLGDLVYKGNAFFKNIVAKELTGARKLLVRGNHDKGRYSFYRDCGFTQIKPFSIEYGPIEKSLVTFSHYPLRHAEPGLLSGARIHLHGHIHNNGYGGKDSPFTPFSVGQINLSAEQTKYRPVNLARLLDGMIYGCYEPEHPAAR